MEDYGKTSGCHPVASKSSESLYQELFDGEILEWVILVNWEPVLLPADAESDVPFLADFLDVLLQL